MKGRTVSLPDLATEKRRNTTLSLSEGFAGARYDGALGATSHNLLMKPQGPHQPGIDDDGVSSEMERVLQIYYRTRQLVLGTEKAGQRVPQKLQSDLRAQEKAMCKELRPVHPLFFQRFDDAQLERLLRSMSFLRLSQGRWIFGGEHLAASWPSPNDQRAFLLLAGRVSLYPDSAGDGEKTEIGRGRVFGERRFTLADEGVPGYVCGAAQCEKPCIIGVLSAQVLDAAFADRAFGNKRIAQVVRHVPALGRIMLSDGAPRRAEPTATGRSASKASAVGSATPPARAQLMKPEETGDFNAVVMHSLGDLCKAATTVHVSPHKEILSDEPLDDSVIIVSRGQLQVRGDVTLKERLEAIPPKKVRIKVNVDKAVNLAGNSIFDTLDPYCIVKIGDFKRFQTPVLWNAGPNPKFEHEGVLTIQEDRDKMLEFTIMDRDKITADDPCGNGSIPLADLPHGWSGYVELKRAKKGLFGQAGELEEPAGKLYFSVRYDFEDVTNSNRQPKVRTWKDVELFTLNQNDCWGHEALILGPTFKRTLEQASVGMTYALVLGNFRVVGSYNGTGNEVMTCWKAKGQRFTDFVKQCNRWNQFTQACRVSTLEKQHTMKALTQRLIRKWEIEEQQEQMQTGLLDAPPLEEAMDPSHFRVAYRGVKAHITVRNAVNLTGGGWFDKLDPYAVVRFRGSKQEFRTAALQDAGSDPVWDGEGVLTYNGEVALELSVWDYDKYSADDLIGTGVIQVGQFAGGFEGMVHLAMPGNKKNKTMKQSMIIIGIQWDPPRHDPNATATLNTTSLTGLRSLTQGA
mmetsp:Transcript_4068/g.12884  ORF Transcript_4068/g.12884 Transcript_4068/m.12884 type:complete len:799 (-) Transcript_4068:37-2433(-)